jgi:hypothetical protein
MRRLQLPAALLYRRSTPAMRGGRTQSVNRSSLRVAAEGRDSLVLDKPIPQMPVVAVLGILVR